jgi:hypothetical protein
MTVPASTFLDDELTCCKGQQPRREIEMLTGNFTGELNRQRVNQLQAEVSHHRTVQKVTQRQRNHKQLTKPVVVVYRRALGAVALGLLLVLGLASTAIAMPQAPEPGPGVAGSASTSHVSTSVHTSSAWSVWLVLGLVGVAIVMTALAKRRTTVTA